jgi:hypothetical protein
MGFDCWFKQYFVHDWYLRFEMYLKSVFGTQTCNPSALNNYATAPPNVLMSFLFVGRVKFYFCVGLRLDLKL